LRFRSREGKREGGANFVLAVFSNPGSRLFAKYITQCTQCCVIFFLFLPLSATLVMLLLASSSASPVPFFLSPSNKVIGNELSYRNTSTGFHEVENCNYIKKFSYFILPRWHEAAYSIALSFLIAPHVTVSKLLNATECTQECLR